MRGECQELGRTAAQQPSQPQPHARAFQYRPRVDILEHADRFELQLEMAGADAQSIDVQFDDGKLSVHAQIASRGDKIRYLRQEYGVGDYYREFHLGKMLDSQQISARYVDGVLTLCVPKRPEATARRIVVNAT